MDVWMYDYSWDEYFMLLTSVLLSLFYLVQLGMDWSNYILVFSLFTFAFGNRNIDSCEKFLVHREGTHYGGPWYSISVYYESQ